MKGEVRSKKARQLWKDRKQQNCEKDKKIRAQNEETENRNKLET